MRKIKPQIIFIVVLILVSSVFSLWFFWAAKPACSTNCQNKIFVIKKGESLGEIAQNLEDEGLIHSSLVFQFITVRLRITRKIQAGDFRLNPRMSMEEIAQELTHGTLDRWVTLIEGWRREQIGRELTAELKGEQSQFNEAEFIDLTKNFEGKLFPDTYLIPRDADAPKVVDLLTGNFEKKTEDLNLDRRTLILASIVEREAKYPEDRPIVAGILLNRLNSGMLLQADATVQYAIATKYCSSDTDGCEEWWPKNLTGEDLKINSLYNTYVFAGLPPAPICSPGLDSIKAALNLQETDYWFYLSDKEGKMHYAKTFEEHNQNIERYLR